LRSGRARSIGWTPATAEEEKEQHSMTVIGRAREARGLQHDRRRRIACVRRRGCVARPIEAVRGLWGQSICGGGPMHSTAKVMVSGLFGLIAIAAIAGRAEAASGLSPNEAEAGLPTGVVPHSGAGAMPPSDIGRDEMLLVAIGAWLGAEFGLPPMVRLPAIERSSTRRMTGLRYGATWSSLADSPEVMALYEEEAATIHLPDGWTGRSPAEMSILVHELVHHLQSLGNLSYECPEAREALAYQAQNRWLELFGSDLETDFQIDGLTLLVRTNCLH
jgi:hypothetical protein